MARSKYKYVTDFVRLEGPSYPGDQENRVQGYFINHHVIPGQEDRYIKDNYFGSSQQFLVCRHPFEAIPCLNTQGIIPGASADFLRRVEVINRYPRSVANLLPEFVRFWLIDNHIKIHHFLKYTLVFPHFMDHYVIEQSISVSEDGSDHVLPIPAVPPPVSQEDPGITILWHGSDGLSTVSWFYWFQEILTKAQFEELTHYVCESFN